MTDIDTLIARVRELDAGRAWKPPWAAHTFEIDCPCPNGEHCGETHTCEEVEAPEAYPDGQCVVQIDVPGLERFARPTAELIAEYRTAAPLLAAEVERLRAQVAELRAALEPFAGFDITARTGAGLRKSDWDNARLALAGAK